MTKRFFHIEIQTFFSVAPKEVTEYDARGIPSVMGFNEIIPNRPIPSPVFPFAENGFRNFIFGTDSRSQTFFPSFFLLWARTYGSFNKAGAKSIDLSRRDNRMAKKGGSARMDNDFIQSNAVDSKRSSPPFRRRTSCAIPIGAGLCRREGGRVGGPQRFTRFDCQREDVPLQKSETFSLLNPNRVQRTVRRGEAPSCCERRKWKFCEAIRVGKEEI
jgi:hypothetical protein